MVDTTSIQRPGAAQPDAAAAARTGAPETKPDVSPVGAIANALAAAVPDIIKPAQNYVAGLEGNLGFLADAQLSGEQDKFFRNQMTEGFLTNIMSALNMPALTNLIMKLLHMFPGAAPNPKAQEALDKFDPLVTKAVTAAMAAGTPADRAKAFTDSIKQAIDSKVIEVNFPNERFKTRAEFDTHLTNLAGKAAEDGAFSEFEQQVLQARIMSISKAPPGQSANAALVPQMKLGDHYAYQDTKFNGASSLKADDILAGKSKLEVVEIDAEHQLGSTHEITVAELGAGKLALQTFSETRDPNTPVGVRIYDPAQPEKPGFHAFISEIPDVVRQNLEVPEPSELRQNQPQPVALSLGR